MDPLSQDQQHSPEHAGGTCDPYTFPFFNLIRIQVSVKMFLGKKIFLAEKWSRFTEDGWVLPTQCVGTQPIFGKDNRLQTARQAVKSPFSPPDLRVYKGGNIEKPLLQKAGVLSTDSRLIDRPGPRQPQGSILCGVYFTCWPFRQLDTSEPMTSPSWLLQIDRPMLPLPRKPRSNFLPHRPIRR